VNSLVDQRFWWWWHVALILTAVTGDVHAQPGSIEPGQGIGIGVVVGMMVDARTTVATTAVSRMTVSTMAGV
jgi:hypothetical protein